MPNCYHAWNDYWPMAAWVIDDDYDEDHDGAPRQCMYCDVLLRVWPDGRWEVFSEQVSDRQV